MKNFYREKPEEIGLYKWRVESKTEPGVFITFSSKYRWRIAGFDNVKSPAFDYWNGYSVLLPTFIEWDELEEDCRENVIFSIDFEGMELKANPCPFCKKEPALKYSGRYIGSSPIDSDFFYFKCCRWVDSVHFKNPIDLYSVWNNLTN